MVLVFNFTPAVWANGLIITDGSVGTAQTLSAADSVKPVTIAQDMGTTVGNNLFHSFSQFNINAGQTVTFDANNSHLQNVITRVTGPDGSSIDGTLKSTIGKADFFFINPHGVAFGNSARIDVPAAFHVSTADQLQFKDGNTYNAADPESSHLSSAEPTAFGFLGNAIRNNGLLTVKQAQLAVKDGQSMDVVAGDIDIEGNSTLDVAALHAPAGEIRLVARHDAGTIGLQRDTNGNLPLPTEQPTASNAGDISIHAAVINKADQYADVDTRGNGGGRIAVWAKNTTMTNATAYADNLGAKQANSGKGIDLQNQTLKMDSSIVSFDAMGTGKAGTVKVSATDGIRLINGANLKTNAFAAGDAGIVDVQAGQIELIKGGSFSGSSRAEGRGGDITVKAGSITIDKQEATGSTGIRSFVRPYQLDQVATGHAGNISIQTDKLKLVNGGDISTSSWSKGDAGNITIQATDFDLLNGGVVQATAFDDGMGGDVTVDVNHRLTIDGQGNQSRLTEISSQTVNGSGQAGNVHVNAGKVEILNGGIVTTSTSSSADAGTVFFNVNQLVIDAQKNSQLLTGVASYAAYGSLGNAGALSLHAKQIDIHSGGVLSTSTQSWIGHAGNIFVDTDQLLIDNTEGLIRAGVFSEAKNGSSGQVGNIQILASAVKLNHGGQISIDNAADLEQPQQIMPGSIQITASDMLMRDSQISTRSSGNVAAGKVELNISHGLMMDPSFIYTTAVQGDGGKITVNAGGYIYLQNSGFTTSVFGANSNGGDIAVRADNLIMDNGVIQANAVGGSGGNIVLRLGSLVTSDAQLILGGKPLTWLPFGQDHNVIQAATQAGIDGTVQVSVPQLNLSGIIANLGVPQYDQRLLVQDYCGLAEGSSLTRQGAGGLRVKANDLLVLP